MKEVVKKILPEYFSCVKYYDKNFELRKDEDDLQIGDVLILKEWDGCSFTGRFVRRKITYVLRDVPEYGLMGGFCIVSF